ncbi:sulfite exporter TauE/SafE family protein [Stagnihabitans tardus]|uniref:Probable membrane transporter protein n=1 Tax=Stagnihabitans tardus TaxID=2699202 RepID=A0AAE4YCG6_9RHOB|nr:sulfite exporter TauE/SafE family protein [Stagnihabitans tardus]NBZ87674.1 TSUP family transporter [Stagnihabitans tardus]
MQFGDINLLFSLSGLVVGVIVGLTGVGGGSLMTPLLIALFAVEPSKAVGSDLLYAALTKSVGTAVHGKNGAVDWQIVRRLALGSVPATLLTFLVMIHYDLAGTKSGVLVTALACVLVVTAFTMLLRGRIVAYLARAVEGVSEFSIAAMTVVTGVVLGVLVTLTSVGAGAIGVTALLVLYPRMATVRIVGSDIAHAVPLTLVAGLGHWYFLGDVDWAMLASLLIGSVPGIYIGAHLAPRLPEAALRTMLAVVLFLVALKLFGVY